MLAASDNAGLAQLISGEEFNADFDFAA